MGQYEVFNDETGKSYVTVSKEVPKSDAVKIANKFFHEKKEKLKIFTGFVQENTLFFGKKEGNVWVICRK